MMEEPIQDSRSNDLISKHFLPVDKAFVRRDDRQVFLIAIGDGLGYVPFSKTGAELLFEVIGQAHEHHCLMGITNLAFEEWTEIFGSNQLTGALLDRVTIRWHIVEANGESYRLRQARKRFTWKPSTKQDSNQG